MLYHTSPNKVELSFCCNLSVTKNQKDSKQDNIHNIFKINLGISTYCSINSLYATKIRPKKHFTLCTSLFAKTSPFRVETLLYKKQIHRSKKMEVMNLMFFIIKSEISAVRLGLEKSRKLKNPKLPK